uniref:Uncharacterized protein n=1 Tax=Tetranychus urticae TaxID=32264 RepID=T1K5X4_TETUR
MFYFPSIRKTKITITITTAFLP